MTAGKGKTKYKESSDEESESSSVSGSNSDDKSVSEQDLLNVTKEAGGEALDLLAEAAVQAWEQGRERQDELAEGGERVLNGNLGRETHINPVELLQNERIEDIEEASGIKKKGTKKRQKRAALFWEELEQEHKKWIADFSLKDEDLVNQNEMLAHIVEPPDDLTIPLLRYQKEWLAWALKREENLDERGGILADEMGMGKTLQAIALVLARRKILKGIREHESPSSSASSSLAIKGTLVICPMVALMQWEREINRFTSKGSTKVLVYHGPNRRKFHHQFSEYDFVITTYSIVETEYRKYVMPPRQKCQYCGKKFSDSDLKYHLYRCGTHKIKTPKQSKKQKKEAKPKKMLDSNKGKKHGRGDKEMEDGLTIENPVADAFSGKSILHSMKWERIILDEAHYIKDRHCNTTRAVFAIQSTYRWALSGTPLQNSFVELFSLVRFLQIVPYSYYFCKDCDCRSLDHSKAKCQSCDHSGFQHFCWWNKYVVKPLRAKGKTSSSMLLLKDKILKSIMLRRTKEGRAADLALPHRTVMLRRDSLNVVEEDYYTTLYKDSRAKFNTYVEAGTVSNNFVHLFELLTRLRQALDHPYLVDFSLTSMENHGKAVDTSNAQNCSLCHETEEGTVVTCGEHLFCKLCLASFGANTGQCPSCSKPLTVDFSTNKDGKKQNPTTIKGFRQSSILNRIELDNFQTSTKLDALMEEIRLMMERDGSAKGIVFSQFSSFLHLIQFALQKSEVSCVRLDGSMSMDAKDAANTRFTEDPSCRIFLVSLKAGGVALNLAEASHVFLMDPWWNPALEQQARDRIHRIGQHKPVWIVKFIIENTIEERILKLQEKKELLIEGVVDGSSVALEKLSVDDLRFMFAYVSN